MKKTPKKLKVSKVEYLDSYKLKLLFSDATAQTIDFEVFLKNSHHPDIQKYLKLKNFKNYCLIDGDLMRGDFDLIFPVVDLWVFRRISGCF